MIQAKTSSIDNPSSWKIRFLDLISGFDQDLVDSDMGRCREDCEAGIGDILWIQQLVSFVSYSDRLSDVDAIFVCGFGIRVLHDEFCSSYISRTDSMEGDSGSDQFSSGDLRDGFDESLASAVDGKGLEISDSGITGDGDDLSCRRETEELRVLVCCPMRFFEELPCIVRW